MIREGSAWRGAVVAVVVAMTTVALATPRVRLGPTIRHSVIYPRQRLMVTFDHASHVREQGIPCVSCHRLAPTSRSPRDNLLPQESDCVPCHGDTTRPHGRGRSPLNGGCRACHAEAGGRVTNSLVPPARLRFSHAAHREVSCERCHTRVAVRGMATTDDLPSMRLCLGCHDGEQAPRTCGTCHPTLPDGRLRRVYDGESLQPPAWMYGADHGPGWERRHATVATNHVELCWSCHRQHECIACHDGNVRPRDVHPGDWLTTHAIEARGHDQDCRACHREQSFCRTCHLRAGVSEGSPLGIRRARSSLVHESPDWTDPVSPRHAREARRNIATCASCHSGQDCTRCHATVSPHGPDWSRRCRGLRRAGSRACAACHEGEPPPCP